MFIGSGWYAIKWSDGGMDWTSDGALWFDSDTDLEAEIEAAMDSSTETHLPYAEYLGDGDDPMEA